MAICPSFVHHYPTMAGVTCFGKSPIMIFQPRGRPSVQYSGAASRDTPVELCVPYAIATLPGVPPGSVCVVPGAMTCGSTHNCRGGVAGEGTKIGAEVGRAGVPRSRSGGVTGANSGAINGHGGNDNATVPRAGTSLNASVACCTAFAGGLLKVCANSAGILLGGTQAWQDGHHKYLCCQ